MLYRYTDDAELVKQLIQAAYNVGLVYGKDDHKSYYQAVTEHREQLREEILRRLAAAPELHPIAGYMEMEESEDALYETKDDKIHDIVERLKTLPWQGLSGSEKEARRMSKLLFERSPFLPYTHKREKGRLVGEDYGRRLSHGTRRTCK